MILTLGRCQHGMILILRRCWYNLILFLGRSKDGMVLFLGRCWVGMVTFLGRSKDGMVLILGRCWDGMVTFLGRSWDGMVLILGRCWYSLILFLGRRKDGMIFGFLGRRWFGLIFSSGDVKLTLLLPSWHNFSRVIPYVSRGRKFLGRSKIPWPGYCWITRSRYFYFSRGRPPGADFSRGTQIIPTSPEESKPYNLFWN